MLFTSLTIDGVKIETDYVLYLSQRINDIQEIEVGVTSFRALLAETMVSAGDYLEKGSAGGGETQRRILPGADGGIMAKICPIAGRPPVAVGGCDHY